MWAVSSTSKLAPNVESTSPCEYYRPAVRLELSNRSYSSDSAVLLRALDALDIGLAFFDCGGVVLHRNQMLTKLLETPPAAARLEPELGQFTTSLLQRVEHECASRSGEVLRLSSRELEVEGSRYLLSGSYIGFDLLGRGGMLLVTLEKRPETSPSVEAIRQRFGLTRQEARVAQQLALGSLNTQIAAQLHISPHTARNHTQAVFQKLGVRSRAQVGAILLRESKND